MTKCYSCGLEYDWGSCPRCKSFKNIEKQTKLQEKQFKMQHGGGAASSGCIVGLVTAFFTLFAKLFEIAIRLEIAAFKKFMGWMKAQHAAHPDTFWKRVFQVSGAVIALFAVLLVIGMFESQKRQEETRQKELAIEAANIEAQKAGWANTGQIEQARLVGCNDPKCYKDHLAKQEKLKAAEEAKLAAEEKAKAEQKAKADTADKLAASPAPPKAQTASTAKETGDPYYDMELPGYKERFCRAWAKANAACLSGSNYRSCVIARMSMEFNTSSPNFGSTGGYICNEDGSRKY
jgi:hypothetical protein